ncbi:MAG TPA: N-acetylglucosamine-6-phosphate deacetylase [bacterium]|nr:N-acetylglucosamine-6-phosphate deacetylase [bacterium]
MIIAAGRVLAAEADLAPGHLLIEGDRIIALGEGIPPGADRIFPDGVIVPGFVDLQVNGGAGVDLLDCRVADLARLSAYLASTGTTGYLATLITAAPHRTHAALTVLSGAGAEGAERLGVHLEGPVLNPARRGAHEARWLRRADDPEVLGLFGEALPHLRLVTLAPELPGSDALIEWLGDKGVVVALGHTEATYEEALRAFARGARMATHLFNGMRAFHHRDPGLVGAALDDGSCVCGLIADGVHVHPAAVRMAFRLLGPDRIALVTDAAGAAGMPPGRYTAGDQPVEVGADGMPRLADGTLAGSVLRMDEAVSNLARWGIPLRDAARSASATPTRLLGLADRGVLAPGYRADVAVLGEDGRTRLTLVAGRPAYDRP